MKPARGLEVREGVDGVSYCAACIEPVVEGSAGAVNGDVKGMGGSDGSMWGHHRLTSVMFGGSL